MRFLILLAAGCAWGASPFYNVLDYGAHNDGSASSTDAFRAAIQAAKAVGGGTVFVPAGKYVSGPIELVSNLVLSIDAGATVSFPATKLPFAPGRQQGVEALTPVPLIGGRNLENVTLTGNGTLASDNAEWMRLMPRMAGGESADGPNWERLLHLLEVKTPAAQEDYLRAAPELRPSFVRTMDSRNIRIEGLHFSGSPMWTIHLLYSENVTVHGVTTETYPGVHTDGIAIDSSRNVRISDCFIDTGDDGIVIKSGKDADGLRVNRPSEDIVISNCTVHRAHGAVTLGSETSGWIRNLTASNIACHGTQIGVRIKSSRTRGGGVENVSFHDWVMDGVGQAINVTNYYLMEGEVRGGTAAVSARTPVFRGIAIGDMSIRGAKVAADIEGLPEMPIEGLRLYHITASAETGLRAYNTAGLSLADVRVDAAKGPAILIRDSKELELDGVAGKAEPGMPVVRLDRCPGAAVRLGRVPLSLGPGELKTVWLEGNPLTTESRVDYWK